MATKFKVGQIVIWKNKVTDKTWWGYITDIRILPNVMQKAITSTTTTLDKGYYAQWISRSGEDKLISFECPNSFDELEACCTDAEITLSQFKCIQQLAVYVQV